MSKESITKRIENREAENDIIEKEINAYIPFGNYFGY